MEIDRGTGRTTRLVDKAIQDFFNKGVVTIQDHYCAVEATKFLYERITKRLKNEHRNVKISMSEVNFFPEYKITLYNENFNRTINDIKILEGKILDFYQKLNGLERSMYAEYFDIKNYNGGCIAVKD